jgi:septation ring formation regulator EzrA
MVGTLALWALVVAIAVLAVLAVTIGPARRRQRQSQEVAARRIAELRALPAPDELPRAPDLTAGQRRALRRRQHPIAHKRSGRGI